MGSNLKWRNHPVLWAAIGLVMTVVLAAGVVLALQRTGDPKAVSHNAPLIAAVIALGGVFTAQMVSIALEQQRTQEARDLEAQRAGETALQNYFEQVGKLLIEKPLHRASPGDNLSTVVRAQTLSVLEGLDPARKRIMLLFLNESELIYKDKPVVSLEAANLGGAKLEGAYLFRASLTNATLSHTNLNLVDLSEAYLTNANLSNAYLFKASLTNATLRNADLSNANLREANLREADLDYANLRRAPLGFATLSHATLRNATLRYATLSDANLIRTNLREADLGDATLIRANLREADLSNANLRETNLSDANLIRANLRGAELRDVNLSGARGWTEDQLSKANSLYGATMPDGQVLKTLNNPNGPTFEEWLKSQDRKEDAENE
jgi:uncharacterized protein YjbI with pentapeptide repeats